MKPGISFNLEIQLSDPASWIPSFPNPADFRFDYFKLMQKSQGGLAELPGNSQMRVAVIGAGAGGMTVARELYRCGFEVTIYEASDRIGGRLYTVDNPNGNTQAGMEMGAMRMPFFSNPDDNNSVLGYYINYEAGEIDHKCVLDPFPNPGAATGGTGIYINGGYGPNLNYSEPTLISWPKCGDPDNPALAALSKKVKNFGKNFSIPAILYYSQPNDDWSTCWNAMVNHYTEMTFNDLVMEPAMTAEEITIKINDLETFDGNLGGFGVTAEQAELLYTIGTGDGSWGAFYSIGALWFLRCTYFGFDSNLQTVEGLSNPGLLPYYNACVTDSNGVAISPPTYQGIQSLVEYLYYVPAPGASASLYEGGRLFVNDPVTRIEKTTDGITVRHGQQGQEDQFVFVVVSSTQWATQMSLEFIGFSECELPQAKIITANTQHNISSCKLFFPLKVKYWELEGNKIPQIIVTDTYIQDIYALSWTNKPDDHGVLLASYTWEDDSLKLLPFNKNELSALVLAKLMEITQSTVGEDITQYIDETKPVTIQWINEPTYIGCAKLYRAWNEVDNMLDLSYNQNYGAKSNLYFAGENYGVEGGWTEPALRSGLDCVLQLLNNVNANFNAPSFDFAIDYPKW